MIQLADKKTRPFVRNIWKEVFEDDDVYMDLFFDEKYADENSLVALDGNRVVASLQMLPYEITFYGTKIPFYYLAGLSTLPDCRKQGWMAQLILKSHELMQQRGIPLSILIPAETSLCKYYAKFGYTQTFRESDIDFEFTVKEIWRNARDEAEAYEVFDKIYNQHDFCVQKSPSDFRAIIRNEINEGFDRKSNLDGLARIIDPLWLLGLYAAKNTGMSFTLQLTDIQFGEKRIAVENGSAKLVEGNSLPDLCADEKLLASLLFGFDTHLAAEPFRSLFPPQHPIMNYMLE